jgi:hypothetical protein
MISLLSSLKVNLSGSKNTNKLGGSPLKMVMKMEIFGILMDLLSMLLKPSIATLNLHQELIALIITQIVNGSMLEQDAP